MCFTVKITSDALLLENRYGVPVKTKHKPGQKTKLNGFEHPQMHILTQDSIELCRWGLIPEWVGTREQALLIQDKTLNARSETVFEKASFKQAILKRRCIIPVESFFEWQHRGKGKVPFEIFPTQEKFLSLAGIWETWVSPTTRTPVSGFSILTCHANELMADIHNSKQRMPVVIHPDSIHEWLNPLLDPSAISNFTKPYPDSWLRAETEENLLF